MEHNGLQYDMCDRFFETRGGLWKHRATHKHQQRLQRQQGGAGNIQQQQPRLVDENVGVQREILCVWVDTPLTDDDLLNNLLRRHWRAMVTHHLRGNVKDLVNFRL